LSPFAFLEGVWLLPIPLLLLLPPLLLLLLLLLLDVTFALDDFALGLDAEFADSSLEMESDLRFFPLEGLEAGGSDESESELESDSESESESGSCVSAGAADATVASSPLAVAAAFRAADLDCHFAFSESEQFFQATAAAFMCSV
jgi:hypothetical protein